MVVHFGTFIAHCTLRRQKLKQICKNPKISGIFLLLLGIFMSRSASLFRWHGHFLCHQFGYAEILVDSRIDVANEKCKAFFSKSFDKQSFLQIYTLFIFGNLERLIPYDNVARRWFHYESRQQFIQKSKSIMGTVAFRSARFSTVSRKQTERLKMIGLIFCMHRN